MRGRSIIALFGLLVAAGCAVNAYLRSDLQNEKDNMIVLRTTDWARQFKPFTDDVEEIGQIWGEPLPERLLFIGGLDWPAWGYFYRDPGDPSGIVWGEARDRAHLYVGSYRYVLPEQLPVDEISLDDFEISGLDGDRVILHRRNQPPPVDYFFLEPTDPGRIRRPDDRNPQ